ncbi:DUF6665 family protein [Pelagibacterium mangrovi]|jgi:hypothetical protein|uniref:DUF6665 family protein n=1 Tax=Pelagibacterium mangrovi TaxID=3119828 RepID=UPI002FCC553E
MTLRDSLDLIKAVNPEGGFAVLEHEVMAERAASLGAAEQRVAKTVSAYNESQKDDRSQELAAAQNAVWAYFVQRELCGFKRHQDIIAAFSIPREVLNGLGAIRT